MTPEQKEKRIAALTRLALATREKLDRAAYVVFVDATATVPIDVFEAACRRLEAGSAWFPRVHELLEECRAVVRYRDSQRRPLRALAAGDVPITEAHLAELRARVAEAVERRRMR